MSRFALPVTDVSGRPVAPASAHPRTDRAPQPQTVAPDGSAVTATFRVSGMTCGHCVRSVTTEVAAGVPGVSAVQVDLPTGFVTVTADRPVDESALRQAIDEAGYELVEGSLR